MIPEKLITDLKNLNYEPRYELHEKITSESIRYGKHSFSVTSALIAMISDLEKVSICFFNTSTLYFPISDSVEP